MQRPDDIARQDGLTPEIHAALVAMPRAGLTPELREKLRKNWERANRRRYGMEWDDLPAAVRGAIFVSAGLCAIILAILAGMLVLHIMSVTAANAADPLAGAPW